MGVFGDDDLTDLKVSTCMQITLLGSNERGGGQGRHELRKIVSWPPYSPMSTLNDLAPTLNIRKYLIFI